jgi:hypothetical protein
LSSSIEQQDDYDEILKDIIRGLRVKPKTDQQIIYEKKYFDYLPNEIVDSDDAASEDLTVESVNPDSDVESAENIKRKKRDTSVRDKRHYQIYHQPLHHYTPYPNVQFYIPYDLFSDFSDHLPAFQPRSFYPQNSMPSYNSQPSYNYPSRFNPGSIVQNPTARFNPPGNFYLPPPTQPPRRYLPASVDAK